MHVWYPLQRLQVEIRKLYEGVRRSPLQSSARVRKVAQVLWSGETGSVLCIVVLQDDRTDLSTISVPMANDLLWRLT